MAHVIETMIVAASIGWMERSGVRQEGSNGSQSIRLPIESYNGQMDPPLQRETGRMWSGH